QPVPPSCRMLRAYGTARRSARDRQTTPGDHPGRGAGCQPPAEPGAPRAVAVGPAHGDGRGDVSQTRRLAAILALFPPLQFLPGRGRKTQPASPASPESRRLAAQRECQLSDGLRILYGTRRRVVGRSPQAAGEALVRAFKSARPTAPLLLSGR